MTEPLPTRRKVFDLQGEAQINEDGINRQYELLRSEPGEPATLRRDPKDPLDPDAILALSARGVPIGRLTSQDAQMLAPLLDKGRQHRARLHCIRGGVPDFPNYGARISIAWDGKPELAPIALDEAQLSFREKRRRRLAPMPQSGTWARKRNWQSWACWAAAALLLLLIAYIWLANTLRADQPGE